ncbi:MAG: AMP-binding protein, partial [Planctomycetota bacterium]
MSSSDANIAWTLTQRAESDPDLAAIHQPGKGRNPLSRYYETLTFKELEDYSNQLANALLGSGIKPGSRAVLMVRPSLEFFGLTFAVFKAGIIPVFIDPGMGVRGLGKCIEESRATAFIAIPAAHWARRLFGWGRGQLKQFVVIKSVSRLKSWGSGLSGTMNVASFPKYGLSWSTITSSASNTGTYAWTVPMMNSSTQALIRLTNTSFPSAVDTSNAVFTIKAPITVDYPNLTSDTLTGCSTINIQWSKTTAFENYTSYSTCYNLSNGSSYPATYEIYYSTNGSTNWTLLTTQYNYCSTHSYTYSWTVPDLAPGSLRIKVIGKQNTNYYGSNPPIFWQDSSDFNVPVKNPTGIITVTNPNGGVTLNALTNYNTTWTANGTSGYYDVLYSTNSGASYTTVVSNISSNNYTWNVNN